MGKFVGKDRRAIRIDGDPNTIWVVDKLNYGMRQRILSAMAHISASTSTGAVDGELAFDVGAFNLAVAREAIVAWDGPDFDGTPVTAQSIAELDFDDPLVKAAMEAAADRAMAAMSPNPPTPATPTGGPN